MLGGMLEGTANVGEIGNLLAIFRIAFHRAITEAESESGVRRLGKSAFGETRFGNGAAVASFHGIDLVIVLFADSSRVRIDRSHHHDERIVAGLNGGGPALVKLLAERDR